MLLSAYNDDIFSYVIIWCRETALTTIELIQYECTLMFKKTNEIPPYHMLIWPIFQGGGGTFSLKELKT